mmetsp:Transcript_16418/g.47031  ORF Transcript_16418/g.47031 Transcript_16418/m.47031 type:complete len:404 (+) Transcript_16418:97-1308(+)
MHSAAPPVIVFLLLAPSLSWSFTQISVPRTNWLGRAPSPSNSFSNRLSFQLHAATSDPHDEAGNEKLYHGGSWKLTNDFTTFLNQVTIQSLIFLINSLKDRHTALWLEDFTQPVIRSGFKDIASEQVLSDMAKAMSDAMQETQMERPIRLLTYHGIGAINTTIFPTWDSYFEQLLQEDGVTYSIESSRPNVPSYELEINPASLCSRLISVREQIAKEFVNDLDVIAEMSAAMMQRYLDSHGTGEMEDSNLLFLEGDYEYTPSPLRKGNFDLLLTITTQEAIHRVLNDEAFQQSDKSSVLFLRNFYLNRIPTHFSGSNWYGKAEGFLSELLKSSPSVVQLQDEDCDLVDPLRVADLILIKREQVAEEWLELALDVPESHTDIKRMQFNRLMGRAIDEKVESGFE